MFSRVYSGGLIGIDSYRIDVEVDCCGGIGQISVVGLPDAAVKESQERVRSAIKSCSMFLPPAKRWIVNMAPADLRKEGPSYDLPIAIGILASCDYIPIDNLSDLWIIGELGLDGSVRPVSGVLAIAISCKKSGAKGIIVPEANAEEAALVDGLDVYPVSHLRQAVLIVEELRNGAVFDGSFKESFARSAPDTVSQLDFREVKGQCLAKQAMEVAAAGRHNVLMVGPPGSGKSMLAERLPGIMPPLEYEESLELTKLYSVAGLVRSSSQLIRQRPFRAPHHSSSVAGLVGGGKTPRPGDISLSHLGILFLDELTEFSRSHLDNLRQPLETHRVTISRVNQTLCYPASFLFVGACNPCPCGYRGDNVRSCICTPGQADRYWSRLSGPLLDRIDIKTRVKRLDEPELLSENSGESSETMRLRVIRAVERQKERNVVENANGSKRFFFNAEIPSRLLDRICPVSPELRQILAHSVTQMGFSARAYDRMLRVARTIADLKGQDEIKRKDIGEAIGFRNLVGVPSH